MCDMRILATGVSKRHCRLFRRSGKVFIQSTEDSPVLVNGEPITDSRILKHGDVVGISGRLFRFQYVQSPASSPTAPSLAKRRTIPTVPIIPVTPVLRHAKTPDSKLHSRRRVSFNAFDEQAKILSYQKNMKDIVSQKRNVLCSPLKNELVKTATERKTNLPVRDIWERAKPSAFVSPPPSSKSSQLFSGFQSPVFSGSGSSTQSSQVKDFSFGPSDTEGGVDELNTISSDGEDSDLEVQPVSIEDGFLEDALDEPMDLDPSEHGEIVDIVEEVSGEQPIARSSFGFGNLSSGLSFLGGFASSSFSSSSDKLNQDTPRVTTEPIDINAPTVEVELEPVVDVATNESIPEPLVEEISTADPVIIEERSSPLKPKPSLFSLPSFSSGSLLQTFGLRRTKPKSPLQSGVTEIEVDSPEQSPDSSPTRDITEETKADNVTTLGKTFVPSQGVRERVSRLREVAGDLEARIRSASRSPEPFMPLAIPSLSSDSTGKAAESKTRSPLKSPAKPATRRSRRIEAEEAASRSPSKSGAPSKSSMANFSSTKSSPASRTRSHDKPRTPSPVNSPPKRSTTAVRKSSRASSPAQSLAPSPLKVSSQRRSPTKAKSPSPIRISTRSSPRKLTRIEGSSPAKSSPASITRSHDKPKTPSPVKASSRRVPSPVIAKSPSPARIATRSSPRNPTLAEASSPVNDAPPSSKLKTTPPSTRRTPSPVKAVSRVSPRRSTRKSIRTPSSVKAMPSSPAKKSSSSARTTTAISPSRSKRTPKSRRSSVRVSPANTAVDDAVEKTSVESVVPVEYVTKSVSNKAAPRKSKVGISFTIHSPVKTAPVARAIPAEPKSSDETTTPVKKARASRSGNKTPQPLDEITDEKVVVPVKKRKSTTSKVDQVSPSKKPTAATPKPVTKSKRTRRSRGSVDESAAPETPPRSTRGKKRKAELQAEEVAAPTPQKKTKQKKNLADEDTPAESSSIASRTRRRRQTTD